MWGCSAQARQQRRMALVELLHGQAALLLHQVDEPEVPRPEHHDLAIRDVVLRPLLLGAPGGLAHRVLDHRVLLVAAGEAGDLTVCERALDELVEPVAVALLEGRALRLPVVREDHDLVRARRVPARAPDAAELLVELAEGLERVGALEARVVSDLVVACEGRIHGRAAAHHVAEDAEDDEVADDHAHRAAHERIDPAAVAARAHVAPARAHRRGDLQQDLPPEQHECARHVESVGEEGAVAGVGALLRLGAAHRQDRLLRLAGEQVAAARPAVHEQPDSGGVAALDLGAVRGRRAGHHQPALLLHPAEGGDVLVRAEQDAGLAGAGLRRQVGLPLGQAGGRGRRSGLP